jgi:ABC-type dipeptide/oligopeptide/nickel transport system ATPase component
VSEPLASPGTLTTSNEPAVVVTVDKLGVAFGTADHEVAALTDVSLQLREGETLGLVGVTGAGKTVLARAMMGLTRAPGRVTRGSINLFGENLLTLSAQRLTELRGKDVALIVSSPKSHLNPLLSVGKQLANVIAAKTEISKKDARDRAVELLTSVSIGDPKRVAASLPHELSGGMAQRVIIAMALANSPRLLIADEPTAGLDVTVQRQVLELMMTLVEETGAALLIMTRDLGIIAQYTERVCVLSEGRVIEERPVDEFFENPHHPHSAHLLQAAYAALGEGPGG